MARHPGSIAQHGNRYRVRLMVRGRRHSFTLPEGATKAEAVQFSYDKAAELRRRGGVMPGPRMRFSELLARWQETRLVDMAPNTRATLVTTLRAWTTYWVELADDPGVGDIGRGAVNAYLDWRRRHAPDGRPLDGPLAGGTMRLDRRRLHALFAFAEELEIVETNPVTKTKPARGDTRSSVILTATQYEALLAQCEGRPMLAMYTLTLGEAGLRCDSEALWLRWEDIDLERALLAIESGRGGHRTKSGKSRRVPLTARLRAGLREHMASFRLRTYHGQRSPWVFHHELNRPHAPAGARIPRLIHPLMRAAVRADLPEGFVQHDLRHRRVTEWLRANHSPHKVQLAMGHGNLATTMHYAHLIDEDLLSLVEPVEQVTGTDW